MPVIIPVEGGISGLLMVAEKYLNLVHLQLKDMRTRKLSNNLYQFEKFEPSVAVAWHTQSSYVNDKAGDSYLLLIAKDAAIKNGFLKGAIHKKYEEYTWLFLVNGQLFPTLNVAERPYFRVANTNANATYRLMLVPETASQ